MADTKISALPTATLPLAGTEVLPIVQGGTTDKVAVDDLTVKNIRSNATTGLLQITGPATGATRVMTTPNANFTAARTDAAQTFTGRQSINAALGLSTVFEASSAIYEVLAAFRSLPLDGINPYLLITTSSAGVTLEQNGSAYRALILRTGAADRVTVAAGGDVTVNTGSLVIGTSGKGVTLPGGITWTSGSGSPEGVITAPVGSLFSRSDGGAGTSLYVKQSGSGNTGWVGK